MNVQLYLRKASTQALDSDILSAALYHSPQDSQPLVTVPLTYSQITRSFPVTIAFPAQNDPPGQSYYLSLSTNGGPLALYGRAEDANPDGSLFINGEAQAQDAAMRTAYDYNLQAMLGDLARQPARLVAGAAAAVAALRAGTADPGDRRCDRAVASMRQ